MSEELDVNKDRELMEEHICQDDIKDAKIIAMHSELIMGIRMAAMYAAEGRVLPKKKLQFLLNILKDNT